MFSQRGLDMSGGRRIPLVLKLLVLFVLPFLGTVIILFLLHIYLQATRWVPTWINIAGLQRMQAIELLSWAEMVAKGQEDDRAGLRKRTKEFDQNLEILRFGGTFEGRWVPPLPGKTFDSLIKLVEDWKRVKLLLVVIEREPVESSKFRESFRQLPTTLRALRDKANNVVRAIETWSSYQTRNFLYWTILGGVINFFFILVGTGYVIKFIFNPVRRLQESVVSIARGDFSINVQIPSRDEIGILARSFDDMRQRLQRLIHNQQEAYRELETLVENLPIAAALLDRDLIVLRANRKFYEIFETEVQECESKQAMTFMCRYPELIDEIKGNVKTMQAFPTRHYTIKNPEGLKKVFLSTGITLKLGDHHPIFLLTIEDITHVDELSSKILILERRFYEFVENSQDAIITMDSEGRIVFFNKEAESKFGYSREEALGRAVEFLVPPPLREEHQRSFERFLKTHRFAKEGKIRQVSGLRKDGTIFPVEISLTSYEVEGELFCTAVIRDVSDLVQVEEELEVLEKNFRLLIEQSPDAVAVHREGKFVYVNPSLVDMLGYDSREELEGQPIETIIHPDDLETVRMRIQDMIATGNQAPPMEEKFVGKDGRLVYAEVVAMPIEFAGKPSIVAIGRDITQRKRLEIMEEYRRNILIAFVEGASLPIILHMIVQAIEEDNPTARVAILLIDPITERLKTVASSELPNFLIDALHQIPIPASGVSIAGVPFGKEPLVVENVATHPSWESLREPILKAGIHSCWTYPVISGEDNLLGYLVIFYLEPKKVEPKSNLTCITMMELVRLAIERKISEEKLLQNEKRLRQALKIAQMGYWSYDLVNNNLTLSSETYRLFGLEEGTPVSYEVFRGFVHPDDRERVDQAWNEGLEGAPCDLEYRIIVDSKELWVHEIAEFSYNDKNVPTFAKGIVRDITPRKKAEIQHRELEQQFLQAQKMEAIGRLAGGIAHDFNNILTAILGNAELTMVKMEPENPFYRNLEEIRQAALRATELNRKILGFARKQPIQPIVLNINERIKDMIVMLKRLISENIILNWMPGPNVWEIWMDPGQLDQVLANLVVNARDAITGSGTITIQTENVVVDDVYAVGHKDAQPGEYVCLSVSDTGCGISEENMKHIFEPFFTTKPPERGTGLGLSTVYGIINQNKGWIHVYSEVGKGTRFRIYLPRKKEGAFEVPTQVETHSKIIQGSETILLVEDDAMVLELNQTRLKMLGYNVLVANHPDEALAHLDGYEDEIHLLITDLAMPGMNGLELYREARNRRPTLRCLVMSGYPREMLSELNDMEPFMRYLEKPFSIDDLAFTIRDILKTIE